MTFAYINPMGKYLAVYFFSTYNKLHAKVVLVYDIVGHFIWFLLEINPIIKDIYLKALK